VGDDPGDAAGVGEPTEVLPVGQLVDCEVGRERQEVRGHDSCEAKALTHGRLPHVHLCRASVEGSVSSPSLLLRGGRGWGPDTGAPARGVSKGLGAHRLLRLIASLLCGSGRPRGQGLIPFTNSCRRSHPDTSGSILLLKFQELDGTDNLPSDPYAAIHWHWLPWAVVLDLVELLEKQVSLRCVRGGERAGAEDPAYRGAIRESDQHPGSRRMAEDKVPRRRNRVDGVDAIAR